MGQSTHYTYMETHLQTMDPSQKIKHVGEALNDHVKELMFDADITDKHKRVQDELTDLFNPYFGTPLYIILYTSITARRKWFRLIKTSRETTCTDKYTIFYSSKPLCKWLGIQSTP